MAPYTGNSVTTRLNIAFIFSIVEVHEHAVNYTQTKNRFAKKKTLTAAARVPDIHFKCNTFF